MQWLNYHHLYYFKVIATEGSIARAAEKLRLGQPTLSAQLKQLEEMIGKSLFIRRNRKLVLTDAGKSALEYANEIFKLGDEMVEVLKDQTIFNQTHLQIGALDSVPKSIILALIKEAYKISPCTISILEGRSDELLRELYNHRIDLILSNFSSQAVEEMQVYSKSVAKLQVSMFASSKFNKLKKNFPKSLDNHPIILPTMHSKLSHDVKHFLKLHNIRALTVAETQDNSLQRLLATEGIGIAPLSEVVGDDNNRLVKIGQLEGVFEEFWLISAQRRIENPVASKLFDSFSLY